MKPSLVIKDVEYSEEENVVQVVKNFIANKLEITQEIGIKQAYRLGKKSKFRPIMVHLSNSADKAIIFSNTKNSRGNEKNLFHDYSAHKPAAVTARQHAWLRNTICCNTWLPKLLNL